MTRNSAIDEAEQGRADLYRLLAAALSHPPTAGLLDVLRALPVRDDGSAIAAALAEVAGAARVTTLAKAQRDYDALFVGVARGELVPYASYYLTGFLHDRPLARLREDLAALGLSPAPGHSDPEDHAGTLCELMAGFIDGGHGVPQPLGEQLRFFERHLAGWLERFFADLADSRNFELYALIGALGLAFLEVERLAFQMETL